MIARALDRRTNLPIVTETRAATPFRAVPREVSKQIAALDGSKKFLVRYQDLIDLTVTATRCWKCGHHITGYQPVLRRVAGSSGASNAELVKVKLNGQETLLSSLLPYNHYREGLFAYRTPDQRLAQFTFLHCADCHIQDADGPDLVACLLGCPDWKRDLMKAAMLHQTDDEWAQSMFRWSGIELVGRSGPSLGPTELMQGKG